MRCRIMIMFAMRLIRTMSLHGVTAKTIIILVKHETKTQKPDHMTDKKQF